MTENYADLVARLNSGAFHHLDTVTMAEAATAIADLVKERDAVTAEAVWDAADIIQEITERAEAAEASRDAAEKALKEADAALIWFDENYVFKDEDPSPSDMVGAIAAARARGR